MAKPKNQRNRSSANTNSNNNQVNGHVDAIIKTADLPVDCSTNKPTETGDSQKNSQKELDTQKQTTSESPQNLDSGDKASENAENSNINKECTGLYKNERLAQCLTSCIGAETRLTVVNGAEYTGFFHTFSENSELVVDTVHRTKVPYQERDTSNKKNTQQKASNATSSETDKDSKKSASNQAGSAQQPVPLQLNSSRELPKSTEITDDLIFPPETFVMMEFDSLDFQECKMLLSQLTKQEKDQKLAENTAQTEADLSKILSAFSPTAKVPDTASSPSAEVGSVQAESNGGLDPAILNSIKSTKSSKKSKKSKKDVSEKSEENKKFLADDAISKQEKKKVNKADKVNKLVEWKPDEGDSDSEKYKLDGTDGWDVKDMYSALDKF